MFRSYTYVVYRNIFDWYLFKLDLINVYHFKYWFFLYTAQHWEEVFCKKSACLFSIKWMFWLTWIFLFEFYINAKDTNNCLFLLRLCTVHFVVLYLVYLVSAVLRERVVPWLKICSCESDVSYLYTDIISLCVTNYWNKISRCLQLSRQYYICFVFIGSIFHRICYDFNNSLIILENLKRYK